MARWYPLRQGRIVGPMFEAERASVARRAAVQRYGETVTVQSVPDYECAQAEAAALARNRRLRLADQEE